MHTSMNPFPRIETSPVLQSHVHGFTTRVGGVSSGRYASLNLGWKWGDSLENIEQNYQILSEQINIPRNKIYLTKQIHSARYLQLEGEDSESCPPAQIAKEEADALISKQKGLLLGVYTADCLPILVATEEGFCAAIHAGWRGVVQRIVPSVLSCLIGKGCRVDRIRMAIGPSICKKCFLVGQEVATLFPPEVVRILPATTGKSAPTHFGVDLQQTVMLQSTELGVLAGNINKSTYCTSCDKDLFFSYRRDGGKIGQHLNFIVV